MEDNYFIQNLSKDIKIIRIKIKKQKKYVKILHFLNKK